MQFVQPQLISVSLPHGNADRNAVLLEEVDELKGRSLTGARIETF